MHKRMHRTGGPIICGTPSYVGADECENLHVEFVCTTPSNHDPTVSTSHSPQLCGLVVFVPEGFRYVLLCILRAWKRVPTTKKQTVVASTHCVSWFPMLCLALVRILMVSSRFTRQQKTKPRSSCTTDRRTCTRPCPIQTGTKANQQHNRNTCTHACAISSHLGSQSIRRPIHCLEFSTPKKSQFLARFLKLAASRAIMHPTIPGLDHAAQQ